MVSFSIWEAIWLIFVTFVFISVLMMLFSVIVDLFRDDSLSGWGKAGWAVLLIFVPWLGALIYLIARGRSMTERQMAEVEDVRTAQEQYIKDVAGTRSDAASQIAGAKSLLDSGAINQIEFDTLKAKALA